MSEYKFTKKQLAVIQALGNIEDIRTQQEIAADIGVHPETITHWKRIPEFMEAVNREIDISRNRARSTVYKELIKASTKYPQDRKLFFELTGEYIDRKDQRHSGDITIEIVTGERPPIEENSSQEK